eukprot:4704329-Amphidinium_carterae.1
MPPQKEMLSDTRTCVVQALPPRVQSLESSNASRALCQEFAAKKLASTKKEARLEAAKVFIDMDLNFGPKWQYAWMVQFAKEADLQGLRKMFSLEPAGVRRWTPLDPVLVNSALSPLDMANLLVKCLLNDRLLLALSQGQGKKADILEQLKVMKLILT